LTASGTGQLLPDTLSRDVIALRRLREH